MLIAVTETMHIILIYNERFVNCKSKVTWYNPKLFRVLLTINFTFKRAYAHIHIYF